MVSLSKGNYLLEVFMHSRPWWWRFSLGNIQTLETGTLGMAQAIMSFSVETGLETSRTITLGQLGEEIGTRTGWGTRIPSVVHGVELKHYIRLMNLIKQEGSPWSFVLWRALRRKARSLGHTYTKDSSLSTQFCLPMKIQCVCLNPLTLSLEVWLTSVPS